MNEPYAWFWIHCGIPVDARRMHIFLPFLLRESQFCVITTCPDPEGEARQLIAHCWCLAEGWVCDWVLTNEMSGKVSCQASGERIASWYRWVVRWPDLSSSLEDGCLGMKYLEYDINLVTTRRRPRESERGPHSTLTFKSYWTNMDLPPSTLLSVWCN